MSNELTSLITETPEEGYQLAVQLSRKAISSMLPDSEARKKLYPEYIGDARNLTHASEVVAVHFQTISHANNFWKDK